MAIDNDKYLTPAVRGDITGIAINTVVALTQISAALEKIVAKQDSDITQELAEIKISSKKIEGIFDRLIGWTPDGN